MFSFGSAVYIRDSKTVAPCPPRGALRLLGGVFLYEGHIYFEQNMDAS